MFPTICACCYKHFNEPRLLNEHLKTSAAARELRKATNTEVTPDEQQSKQKKRDEKASRKKVKKNSASNRDADEHVVAIEEANEVRKETNTRADGQQVE